MKEDPHQLQKRISRLEEREKEMNCLYAIMELLLLDEPNQDSVYRRVIEVMPAGFQFPEQTGVKLAIEGRTYISGEYREDVPGFQTAIEVDGGTAGKLSVSVDREESGEVAPVLTEEYNLLEKVGALIGSYQARRHSAADLEESKQYYRSLFHSHPAGVATVDLEGNFVNANESVLEIAECSKEEMLGQFFTRFFPEEEHEAMFQRFQQTLQGNVQTYEAEIITARGNRISAHLTSIPIVINGAITGVHSIVQDITAQKVAEQAAEQSRIMLQMIIEQTEASVWVCDAEGRFVLLNQKFQELFGLGDRKVAGCSLSELLDNQTARQFTENDYNVREAGSPLIFEEQVMTQEGMKHYRTNMFPLSDVPGLASAVAGIATDITDLKETERRVLLQQEAVTYLATNPKLASASLKDKLQAIARSSAETLNVSVVNIWQLEDTILRCVCSYHADGRYDVNKGEKLDLNHYPDYLKEVRANRTISVSDVREDPRTRGVAQDYCDPQEIRAILDNCVYLSGEIIGMVGHNYTESPRNWMPDEITFSEAIGDRVAEVFAEEKRRKMGEQIRESLKLKETLLSEIHHRVKNNLSTVSSFLQLQSFSSANEEVRQVLSATELRVRTIALIYEKLHEAGDLTQTEFCAYISELVKSIDSALNPEGDIRLELTCEPLELSVNQAVPCALIINELITNAFQHAFPADSGSNNFKDDGKRVTVEVNRENGQVSVEVSDNGSGLPDEATGVDNDSSGFSIFKILVQQLDAEYVIENHDGTRVSFSFEQK